MGKFHIILLLSVVTLAIISTVESVPLSDSSIQSENAEKCKKLCGFCGCTGYYCGDECLCECNSVTDGEAECVDTMKSNCKKLELPFEVLIQGPNVNRMVRSLLYANPDEEICVRSSETNQKKRSTISIYKPYEIQQKDEILTEPKVEETHVENSPIHVIVAQKLDTTVDAVETKPVDQDSQTKEIVETLENSAADTELNQQSEKVDDDVDRTNIKRHIIDVNQDISEFSSHFDDSFIFKRDAEEKTDEAVEENVGAPAPAPPAPVPAPQTPLLPKIRKALENIPTSEQINNAWETVRNDMNTRINSYISAAQQRAAELRAKLTPPTPSPPPPPVVPAPPKFNPFLRSENEENDVGMALRPAVPLLPLAPLSTIPIETEFAKNIAAARAAIQPSQIVKNLRTNGVIKNWNNLLTPWLLGAPLEDAVGSPQEGDENSVGSPQGDENSLPQPPAEPTVNEEVKKEE